MMKPEELKSTIEELKKEGLDEEEIARGFLAMFAKKEIDVDDLKTLLQAVGFELKGDIEKVLRENPESFDVEKGEEDKEDKEDSKSDEEDKEDSKSNKEDEEDKENSKSDGEDKEWEKANKYFKV